MVDRARWLQKLTKNGYWWFLYQLYLSHFTIHLSVIRINAYEKMNKCLWETEMDQWHSITTLRHQCCLDLILTNLELIYWTTPVEQFVSWLTWLEPLNIKLLFFYSSGTFCQKYKKNSSPKTWHLMKFAHPKMFKRLFRLNELVFPNDFFISQFYLWNGHYCIWCAAP